MTIESESETEIINTHYCEVWNSICEDIFLFLKKYNKQLKYMKNSEILSFQGDGVGSIRILQLKDGIQLKEKLISRDNNQLHLLILPNKIDPVMGNYEISIYVKIVPCESATKTRFTMKISPKLFKPFDTNENYDLIKAKLI